MDTVSTGKSLKEAMRQAAALLTRPPAEFHNASEWRELHQWCEQYHRFFNSPLYGSMELQNKRWIIYCGNDCSPELDFLLPARPSDELAGVAFLMLHEELKRVHGPSHPT